MYEKEYLAVLLAVKHWRHYLWQAEFFIHTDHRGLIHLNEQRLHTAWQQKMFVKLLGLQYKIIYKKGADNGAANALSRRAHSQQSYAILSVTHSWLEEVIVSYQSDPAALELLRQLAARPDSRPPFTLAGFTIPVRKKIRSPAINTKFRKFRKYRFKFK